MAKKNEGKYDPTLVSIKFIEELAKARAYGIGKHGNRNDWLTTHPNEHYKAAARHLNAAMAGEAMDTSGVPHVVLAACNLMFEIHRGQLTFDIRHEVRAEQSKYLDEQSKQGRFVFDV